MPAKSHRPAPDMHQSTLVHFKDSIFVDRETGMVLSRIGHYGAPGYERVWIDGREERAHRVIWEALNGPIPDGLTINHEDGDKTNNHPSNLSLATQSEQVLHAYRTGLRSGNGKRSKRPVTSRLTVDQVRAIRDAELGQITRVAREVGISAGYAARIRSGKCLGLLY